MSEPDPDLVSADQCVICAEWPPAISSTMRFWLLVLPIAEVCDGRVCEACLWAWWRNVTGTELAREGE